MPLSHGYEAVECVRKALELDTEEKPVPSIHIEGYGCLSPTNIKSNIKRYLSELEDCSKDFENEFENINRIAYLLKAHTEHLMPMKSLVEVSKTSMHLILKIL